jgi:uncharacterized membrane protein YoaK (UPF0700 family)
LINKLLIGNWIVPFIITVVIAYIILITLFKASTIQKNKFVISYIIIVIIVDVILTINREKVSPELFKGLSMGLIMGMVYAVIRKNKNTDN